MTCLSDRERPSCLEFASRGSTWLISVADTNEPGQGCSNADAADLSPRSVLVPEQLTGYGIREVWYLDRLEGFLCSANGRGTSIRSSGLLLV